MFNIQQLPKSIIEAIDFKELFAARPLERGKVLIRDRKNNTHTEKPIFRKFKSYLSTPKFDAEVDKAYMFSGRDDSDINGELPAQLVPMYEYLRSIDGRYNQAVVNWYEPEDYIQPHSDCDAKMVDDYAICIVALGETRSLVFEQRQNGGRMRVPLEHGEYIVLDKHLNTQFRHSVPTGDGERISITFRMIKEGGNSHAIN